MDIEARQVIPIIGPELLVLGAETGQPTLYQHLAKELVSRLSLDEERLSEGYSLLEVTSLFFRDPRNRATFARRFLPASTTGAFLVRK